MIDRNSAEDDEFQYPTLGYTLTPEELDLPKSGRME